MSNTISKDRSAIDRDAQVLWQEIDAQVRSGVGCPTVTMNRLHWIALLAQHEILREPSALINRLLHHASLHDSLAKNSDEQAQWGADLREAARLLSNNILGSRS